VIKDGKMIIEDHEFVADHTGRLLYAQPDYDDAIEEQLKPFFDAYYSIRFNNYPVADSYLHEHDEVIPLHKARKTPVRKSSRKPAKKKS